MLNEKKKDYWEIIKTFLSLISGVAIIVFLVIKTVDTIPIAFAGTKATARVISTMDEVREQNDGRQTAVVTIAEYEFVVGDRRFYGRTEVEANSLSEGDKVKIKYHKNDPNKNHAIGDRTKYGNLIIVLVLGGAFAFYLIKSASQKLFSKRNLPV